MKVLVLAIFLTMFAAGCVQQECGIEQCHGLEITCGGNVPGACTEIYQLGDFCRSYFPGCKVVGGVCTRKANATAEEKFLVCKTCVNKCEAESNPEDSFKCENNCRNIMMKYCSQDSECSCGTEIGSGDCFYGNKDFVDETQQCPDFCTGIAGNLVIKCIGNQCVQKQSG